MDSSKGDETHNYCYWKNGNEKYYFESFGLIMLIPPKEVIKYLKSPIMYSTYQIQQFNDCNCSEWSLFVLDKLNKDDDYIDVILSIVHNKTYLGVREFKGVHGFKINYPRIALA